MQKLAVVYFPKGDLPKINQLRKKYDPHWQIIPPHMTLVSPLATISENQLIEHIEKIAEEIQPFSVHFTSLAKTADDCLFY